MQEHDSVSSVPSTFCVDSGSSDFSISSVTSSRNSVTCCSITPAVSHTTPTSAPLTIDSDGSDCGSDIRQSTFTSTCTTITGTCRLTGKI